MPRATPTSAGLPPPASCGACTENTGRIKKSPSIRNANSEASERPARSSSGDMRPPTEPGRVSGRTISLGGNHAYSGPCPGPEQARQGGPYKHACDHFADDLRLTAAPRHPADGPASRQDEEHVQEERNRKFS